MSSLSFNDIHQSEGTIRGFMSNDFVLPFMGQNSIDGDASTVMNLNPTMPTNTVTQSYVGRPWKQGEQLQISRGDLLFRVHPNTNKDLSGDEILANLQMVNLMLEKKHHEAVEIIEKYKRTALQPGMYQYHSSSSNRVVPENAIAWVLNKPEIMWYSKSTRELWSRMAKDQGDVDLLKECMLRNVLKKFTYLGVVVNCASVLGKRGSRSDAVSASDEISYGVNRYVVNWQGDTHVKNFWGSPVLTNDRLWLVAMRTGEDGQGPFAFVPYRTGGGSTRSADHEYTDMSGRQAFGHEIYVGTVIENPLEQKTTKACSMIASGIDMYSGSSSRDKKISASTYNQMSASLGLIRVHLDVTRV